MAFSARDCMFKCIFFFVLSLSWWSVWAMSAGVSVRCGKCEKSRCPVLHYCEGKAVQDHCGCCNVCSDSRFQPHALMSNDEGLEEKGNACAKVECPQFKVCMENMQGLPLCTCPGPFICKQRRSRQRPVCGTDGNTYQSRCYLRIAACNAATRIKVARRGPCTGAEGARPRACDSVKSCRRRKNQHSVCGTDGKTYPSRCHMKIVACQKGAKIKLQHAGRCVSPRRDSQSEQRGLSTTAPARGSEAGRQVYNSRPSRKERRRRKKGDMGGGERKRRKQRRDRDKRNKKLQRRRKRRKTRGQSRQRRNKLDRRQVLRNLGPNNWK